MSASDPKRTFSSSCLARCGATPRKSFQFAVTSGRPIVWRHRSHSDLGRATSSIRPDIIFGKDRFGKYKPRFPNFCCAEDGGRYRSRTRANSRLLERFAVRPIAKADIHLTLVPPWNEPSVPNAIEKLRLAVESHYAFRLEFRHVGYGPDPKRPRLVWVECASSNELTSMRMALMLAFGQKDERWSRHMSHSPAFEATVPASPASARLITTLCSFKRSRLSSGCSRRHLAGVAIRSLRRCR